MSVKNYLAYLKLGTINRLSDWHFMCIMCIFYLNKSWNRIFVNQSRNNLKYNKIVRNVPSLDIKNTQTSVFAQIVRIVTVFSLNLLVQGKKISPYFSKDKIGEHFVWTLWGKLHTLYDPIITATALNTESKGLFTDCRKEF